MLSPDMIGWEAVVFAFATGFCGFAAGMRKLKSKCCCCVFDIERDTERGKVQGVSIRRKTRVGFI